MSKRPTPESLSMPKQKRQKIAKNQRLIHQFFSSPSKEKAGFSAPVQDGSSISPESSSSLKGKSAQGSTPVIDVDALYDEEELVSETAAKPVASESNLSAGQESMLVKLAATSQPLIYDDLTYDPAIQRTTQKPWPFTSVPYSFLAHALSTLTQTRSRITITRILTNCLYLIIRYDPQSLLPALYLLSNTLAPPYSSLELGLGPSIISHSIQHISGLTASALKRLYNSMGDAGDVAFAAKSNLRTLLPHPPLLVNSVYMLLLKIARSKGQGATKEKGKIVEKLLLGARGEEVRFLTRTLSQNLRVGAVRSTILSALARAMVLISRTHLHPQSLHIPEGCEHSEKAGLDLELAPVFERAESLIKRVYVQHPNYEDITSALLQGGLDDLQARVYLTIGNRFQPHHRILTDCLIDPGIPLHPTLGSPTRSLNEVYEISQNRPFIAEFKYDGQRAQIHASLEGESILVKIFSRHLEDMTTKYPDVVHLVKTYFDIHPETTSFILDTEIVPVDSDGELKSFQDLSNRARKDVQLQDVRVFVSVFAFDLMYFNGEVLLERTFRERRGLLLSRFPPFISPDTRLTRFNHVESCASTEGRDVVEAFWGKAVESRCEGLMVKILDNESMTDATSLDKAVKSRRKQLPATYEPDKRTSAWLKLKKDYVTGLGDTLDLIPIGLVPEVYFKPSEVWEIRGADITLSPVSVAAKGLVSASRGLSLRFPRFVRTREDKSIEDGSTPEILAKMWRKQEQRGLGKTGNDEGDLMDVDLDSGSDRNSED
ncbi:hypothetical protein C0991_011388 [Blastosporella zonata]|nr:hypothetical protein C0991_011388 [Blastosporella zonata]